ncbi:MAG: PTS sugar transporter subunit IIA [Candidatus Eisenbacteria bacterium]|nr:PTS sugar transporter subunit IIA [Candidatus Eisenbacteria bacterium]
MHGTMVPSALDSSLYIPELKNRRREAAVAELVACAHRAGAVRRPEALIELIARREAMASSAPGKSIAIPSARSLSVIESRIVVGRSTRGIEWHAPDRQPVQIVLLVLSPAECPLSVHVEGILRLAAVFRLQRHRQRLIEADSYEAAAAVLREAMA